MCEAVVPAGGAPAAGRLPDFLIIGAPRSATTALAGALSDLPDVFIPPEKELHFFTDRWADGVGWYTQHFAPATEPLAGEATPTYLASAEAGERMASVVPDARLIAVLRDPVERAWSHYWHRRVWRREHRDFERALDDEEAGRTGELDGRYVELGLYHQQLQRLNEHFPREAVHVALFDDLVARPATALDAVCAFVGAGRGGPMTLDQDGVRRNASYAARSYRLHWGLWARDLYRRMPSRLAFAIANRNQRPIPALDAKTAGRLRERFAADGRALADWLGEAPPWVDGSGRVA
jgi:hypothetical protein